jgi:MFS family permease
MTAERAQTTFHVTERYRQYVVWLLCAVYLFNHVDRQILAILIQPIKAEFDLSDVQLGLVGGPAFALFYATLGIPIARLADRSSRTNIIAASLALWSLFTALTGLARSFYHLLLARVIVGVGEAGCSPPAYSLIGDYFEPKRRATAIAIYSLGVSGGAIVGLLIGGAIAEAHGWRTAFFVLGVPGIVLAIIVKLTLREPPRGWADGAPAPARIAPVGEVFRALWAKQTFRAISIAAALHAFVAYGVAGFYSAFLIRSHDMGLAQAGRWLAFASIVGGLAGTFFGGRFTDVLTARYNDARWAQWIPTLTLTINLPIGIALFLTSHVDAVIVLLTVNIALGSAFLAPTVASIQRLVSAHERALAAAILLFILNLIGLGLGPIVTGLLSDALNEHFLTRGANADEASADGLRFSMLTMLAANLFSAIFYWRAARIVREESIS